MRVKKQKRHRKIVRFYTACFGFRQLYKVLCDGTFVHHLIGNRITPADKALANTLAAPVKLFTTRCVIDESKGLGQSHSEVLDAARKLAVARCEHHKSKSADACLMEIIGGKNAEHFFVATQDVEMRKKFQEVPGVPLIFGLRNALLLEPPSACQWQLVKASEEERSHMTESEYKMLKRKAKKMLETKEIRDSSDENEDLENYKLEMQTEKRKLDSRKGTGVKDRPQFKRKRAKESKDGNAKVRGRNRKRKRSCGSKKVVVTDS